MTTWIGKKLEEMAATVTREAEMTRAQMAEGLADTKRGIRLDAALAKPFRANGNIYEVGGRLVGWSLRAAGGPVVITFRDGRTPDGDPVGACCLADGQSHTTPVATAGVAFIDALYAEVTGAGTVVGAVWLGTVD